MLVMCMRKYGISFHLVEHSPNLICVLYFCCCSLTSFEQFNCYMIVGTHSYMYVCAKRGFIQDYILGEVWAYEHP